jgi:hypothetical protein
MGEPDLLESSGSFDEEVIGKAILPRLSWLEGPHERMPVLFPVSAGMAILRVVAAADPPANEACPEVNPRVPGGNALFANVRFGNGLSFEASEVITRSRHAMGAFGTEPQNRPGPRSVSFAST